MASPSSLIIAALQMIGEKEIGATLSTAEEMAYLAKLNMMMESWSIQRLLIYQILQENFALTTSTGTYTIGSGGTFNTTRPIKITNAFVRSGSTDYQLQIIPVDSYNMIPQKTVDGSYPTELYYDMGFSSASLATIYLYPEPSAGLTLYIDSWKQLQTFALISTTLVLPPGYELAIVSNLAIFLSAGFRPVQQEVIKIARESLAAIQGLNAPVLIARLDAGIVPGGRRFNINIG